MTKKASVYFEKMAVKDTWEDGCVGNSWHVYDERFNVDFEDTDDLINKLGIFISNNFDVNKDEFLEHVNNECENDRFDYCQGEDADGNKMSVTEDNPNGYLADYMFHVEVFERLDYKFQKKGM